MNKPSSAVVLNGLSAQLDGVEGCPYIPSDTFPRKIKTKDQKDIDKSKKAQSKKNKHKPYNKK